MVLVGGVSWWCWLVVLVLVMVVVLAGGAGWWC